MLNAVSMLGKRAYGANLGLIVWPYVHHPMLFESNSRWICGKARAAQTNARKLVNEGLLVETFHTFGGDDFGHHFELTDAGRAWIINHIKGEMNDARKEVQP